MQNLHMSKKNCTFASNFMNQLSTMKKIVLFLFLFLSASVVMASIPKKDPAVQQQMYKITFGNGSWSLTDGNTGKPSTGLYAFGEKVVLWFEFVATDTDYYFYIDGKEIHPTNYTDKTGFVFEFMMPDHDIHFDWEERNTMLYDPSEDK